LTAGLLNITETLMMSVMKRCSFLLLLLLLPPSLPAGLHDKAAASGPVLLPGSAFNMPAATAHFSSCCIVVSAHAQLMLWTAV
jgi:hypothetical protein